MIRLLDCTLRDGGYVNEFNFSKRQVCNVIDCLVSAGIEYVEAGFLRNSKKQTETTVYTDTAEVDAYLPDTTRKSDIFLMVVYGKFDIDKFPPKAQTRIAGIRVTFKKKEIDDAMAYCSSLIEKGYKVSANPTGINAYTDSEILALLEKINALNPFCFSIVDTLGVLTPQNLLRIYSLVEHNLRDGIAIGFHSHNNLQLSFANAMALINLRPRRLLIIDSCLFGMGRGAGNLSTELMVQHLDTGGLTHYQLLPILKAIDEQISKIYAVTPWGYNIPYYLAASIECHPNYASYLLEKQTISIESINAILLRIPEDKKAGYDAELIKRLYLEYQENAVDDSAVLEDLKRDIGSSPVMLLAPGRSIRTHKAEIDAFIAEKAPFVFSLNFSPEHYNVDTVFVSNAKRFAELKAETRLLITSNIKAEGIPTLNYASYLNNSEMHDNAALMLIAALMNLGIREIWLAGMDGFVAGAGNYAQADMVNNARVGLFDKRNSIMQEMLGKYSKQVNIRFVTPSMYNESV